MHAAASGFFYRPRFENLLDPVPLIAELEPDRVRIAPSSGRARGFELTVEYDDGGTLNGWASYTLSRVTDRIDGVDQLRNWDQRHSLQAGLAWHKKQWEIGLAVKIHSGWPTTPATLEGGDEEDLSLVYGPSNSDRLNTFANVDFRVSRKWPLKKGRITAFFELSNALNRKTSVVSTTTLKKKIKLENFPCWSVQRMTGWGSLRPLVCSGNSELP
jgi:outer membrane receptor protein involved in Fe transport